MNLQRRAVPLVTNIQVHLFLLCKVPARIQRISSKDVLTILGSRKLPRMSKSENGNSFILKIDFWLNLGIVVCLESNRID